MTAKAFGVMPLPEPCASCLATLLAQAEDNPGMARVSTYCPHNFTLAMAEIRQRGDERAVIQWTLRGPIGEKAARAITDAVAKETGTEAVPLDAPKVH